MSDFSKIESLENWIAWTYLSGELGWAPQRIAYELWVNAQRLLEWINARGHEMERLADKQPGQVKEIRAKWQERYPVAKPEDKADLNLDVKKVVKLHREGYKLHEISKKLKVKHSDFIYWWNQHLHGEYGINAELRKQAVASTSIV